MRIIADSGTTKVDWRIISPDGSVKEISTEGINPVFQSKDSIESIIKNQVATAITGEVKEVFFYGAGVVSTEISSVLNDCFSKLFPGSVTYTASDILAAARSLCGHNPGIACIMGTGSNTCFYDGNEIVRNVKAGGFILGDEGSGGVLGKRLLSDFIKELLPKEISDELVKRYQIDYGSIVQKVYREPVPSRYLSSFSPFINEFRSHPYMHDLIKSSFDDFFKKNISHYRYDIYPVNFVGSIAFYYSDILEEAALDNCMTVGKILRNPIIGLTDYHLGLI